MAKNIANSNIFDPFDVFDGVEEEKSAKAKGGESNPWSDSTWNGSASETVRGDTDTSFDSQAGFHFSAEAAEFGYNPFASQYGAPASNPTVNNSNSDTVGQDLFPLDPMATLSGEELALEAGETTVRVVVREQFSTVYDDAGSPPSCFLEGSVYVQPTALAFDDNKTSFCVVVQDPQGSVDQLEEVYTISSNITTPADREQKQTVFRVALPQNSLNEVPIASYTCSPKMRPIPMLVKSKVQVTDDLSRVGFKVRANPSNTEALNNLVILMAIPPFVQGETVKMSRKGGVWDEMKRTICWTVEKLEPGEVLEIQAQFQSGKKQNLAQVDLQFPVLVRADVPRLFSGLNISTDHNEDSEDSPPINSSVSQYTRILHRKV